MIAMIRNVWKQQLADLIKSNNDWNEWMKVGDFHEKSDSMRAYAGTRLLVTVLNAFQLPFNCVYVLINIGMLNRLVDDMGFQVSRFPLRLDGLFQIHCYPGCSPLRNPYVHVDCVFITLNGVNKTGFCWWDLVSLVLEYSMNAQIEFVDKILVILCVNTFDGVVYKDHINGKVSGIFSMFTN